MLEDQEGEFEVLRQPVEGRVEFVKHVQRRHGPKVLGIFGEDTLDKNINIHRDIPGFEFIEVKRPVTANAEKVVIHPIEIDADGISSSKARELILARESTEGILHPDVISYIKRNRLYQLQRDSKILRLQKRHWNKLLRANSKLENQWDLELSLIHI